MHDIMNHIQITVCSCLAIKTPVFKPATVNMPKLHASRLHVHALHATPCIDLPCEAQALSRKTILTKPKQKPNNQTNKIT